MKPKRNFHCQPADEWTRNISKWRWMSWVKWAEWRIRGDKWMRKKGKKIIRATRIPAKIPRISIELSQLESNEQKFQLKLSDEDYVYSDDHRCFKNILFMLWSISHIFAFSWEKVNTDRRVRCEFFGLVSYVKGKVRLPHLVLTVHKGEKSKIYFGIYVDECEMSNVWWY